MRRSEAAIANALVVVAAAYVAIIAIWFPDAYYAGLQEDEYLEWATFWAFAIASALYTVSVVAGAVVCSGPGTVLFLRRHGGNLVGPAPDRL